MKIGQINSTNFESRFKLRKPDLSKLNKSDKINLALCSAGMVTGTASTMIGLDSWNVCTNSGVAENIYNSILGPHEKINEIGEKEIVYDAGSANIASYAMANSLPTGSLSTTLGLDRFAIVYDKYNKKIPD